SGIADNDRIGARIGKNTLPQMLRQICVDGEFAFQNAVALGMRRPHGDALFFKHPLTRALPGSDDPVGYFFFFGLNSFDRLVEQDIAITQHRVPRPILCRAQAECQSALPRAAKTWGDGPLAARPSAGPRKPIPPCSRLDRYRMAACLCCSKEASC